jgi:hypothetical protein
MGYFSNWLRKYCCVTVSGAMVTLSLQIRLLWSWIRKGFGILTLGNKSLYKIPSLEGLAQVSVTAHFVQQGERYTDERQRCCSPARLFLGFLNAGSGAWVNDVVGVT